MSFLENQSQHLLCHSIARTLHNQYLLHIFTYSKQIISLTLTFYHITQSLVFVPTDHNNQFPLMNSVQGELESIINALNSLFKDQNSCIQGLPTFLVMLALWLFGLDDGQASRTTRCMAN